MCYCVGRTSSSISHSVEQLLLNVICPYSTHSLCYFYLVEVIVFYLLLNVSTPARVTRELLDLSPHRAWPIIVVAALLSLLEVAKHRIIGAASPAVYVLIARRFRARATPAQLVRIRRCGILLHCRQEHLKLNFGRELDQVALGQGRKEPREKPSDM